MQVRFIESSDTFWPETPTASPSNESKSEIQFNERIFKIFKIFLEKLNWVNLDNARKFCYLLLDNVWVLVPKYGGWTGY